MGRKRIHADPSRPLPPGLFKHGKQHRARVLGGNWIYFGTDYTSAMAGLAAWKAGESTRDDGTVGGLLDVFTSTVCAGYVKAGRLKARTARDYQRDAVVLKKGIGHIPLKALRPMHVVKYRDVRAAQSSHVRQEIACLSSALAYAVESGLINTNVCNDVSRPRRTKRLRLVTDAEFLAVHAKAEPSVRRAMLLGLRTLALPADVLSFGPRNIVRLPDGSRVLRYERGKVRGAIVEIALVGELAQLVDEHQRSSIVRATFVYTREGTAYSVDGVGSMFRRYCGKAKIADFGLRDLRAKVRPMSIAPAARYASYSTCSDTGAWRRPRSI